jgi:hypothetical protein
VALKVTVVVAAKLAPQPEVDVLVQLMPEGVLVTLPPALAVTAKS